MGRSELSRIRPAPASTPFDQEEKKSYEPVAPANADLSGWEEGFESYEKITKQRQSGSNSLEVSKSASVSGSPNGKKSDDSDGDYKLNSRETPSAHPPDRVVVPPKPTKAWTFKDDFMIAPGGFVDPREISYPSQEYMRLADRRSQNYHRSNFSGKRPKLVVVDLANVLCYRNAGKAGARNAKMRPYLSSFLTYLCGTEEVGGKIQRRFSVMVSSERMSASMTLMLTCSATRYGRVLNPRMQRRCAKGSDSSIRVYRKRLHPSSSTSGRVTAWIFSLASTTLDMLRSSTSIRYGKQ